MSVLPPWNLCHLRRIPPNRRCLSNRCGGWRARWGAARCRASCTAQSACTRFAQCHAVQRVHDAHEGGRRAGAAPAPDPCHPHCDTPGARCMHAAAQMPTISTESIRNNSLATHDTLTNSVTPHASTTTGAARAWARSTGAARRAAAGAGSRPPSSCTPRAWTQSGRPCGRPTRLLASGARVSGRRRGSRRQWEEPRAQGAGSRPLVLRQ